METLRKIVGTDEEVKQASIRAEVRQSKRHKPRVVFFDRIGKTWEEAVERLVAHVEEKRKDYEVIEITSGISIITAKLIREPNGWEMIWAPMFAKVELILEYPTKKEA